MLIHHGPRAAWAERKKTGRSAYWFPTKRSVTATKPKPKAKPATSPAAAAADDGLRLDLRRRRASVAHRAAHPPRRVARLALAHGPPRAPPPRPALPILALAGRVRRRAVPSRGAAPDPLFLRPALSRLGSISLAVVSVQVGSDVAFLADTAAAVASCPGADDAMRGVCHLVMVLCFRSVGLL